MMMIFGNQEKPKPQNDESSVQVQVQVQPNNNSALEDTIECMTATGGGVCSDPRHFHSFRGVPFIMLPLYTCGGCGERLQTYILGSSSRPAVKCIVCGLYAHRHCAFSRHVEWQKKCPVNYTTDDDDDDDDDIICEKGNDVSSVEHDASTNTKIDTLPTESMNDDSSSSSCHLLSSNKNALTSIFRQSTRTTEPLDHQKMPYSINTSASADNVNDERRTQNVQQTRANFPFLSSARLFPSRTTTSPENSLLMIRKCNTWNGNDSPDWENQDHLPEVLESLTSEQKVQNAKDDENDTNNIDNDNDNDDDDDDNNTTAPLHFASHGFRVVSQALQENIIANFNRLIPKESSNKDIHTFEHNDDKDMTDSEINNSSASADKNVDLLGDKTSDQQAHSLLETSEPKQDSIMDRKRLGLATVAGSIVGGVVGVGLAGPVGGVIGIKCGQTAGMLTLLFEGSVLASGITAGIAASHHLQERHENRVLALGEGTQRRVLLMVRPTIQTPQPIWAEIYQQTRRSYSGSGTGLVNRFIPNGTQAAKRERYEREVDIVETGEDELAIADKVLLLVSRILSNKDSLPGHVYRQLIEAFRRRSRELKLEHLQLQLHEKELEIEETTIVDNSSSEKLHLSSTIEDDDQSNDERISSTHQRRQDTHAVIKYVTTSLLLTRPGFGYSSSLTEKTATAVESLVFGEIYDLVMEEIDIEYENRDNLLLEKIANFERKQGRDRDEGLIENPTGTCFGYKSCISEAALEALHCLPQAHSAVDKLRYCVVFLEQISKKFSNTMMTSAMGADSLLKMVCQHILLAKVIGINSQIAFLEEFARDEQLLRGREGYALVTLQASLHFLNASTDFESDIFDQDDDC